VITVEPAEDIVNRVHVNLREPHLVNAKFANASAMKVRAQGLQWIGPGGVPELFR
jgi:hypothetical protein